MKENQNTITSGAKVTNQNVGGGNVSPKGSLEGRHTPKLSTNTLGIIQLLVSMASIFLIVVCTMLFEELPLSAWQSGLTIIVVLALILFTCWCKRARILYFAEQQARKLKAEKSFKG